MQVSKAIGFKKSHEHVLEKPVDVLLNCKFERGEYQ